MENQGENCYKASANGCFLQSINYFFKKDFSVESLEFIHSFKRRPNVNSQCRIPEIYNRYKIEFGIYDPKSKKILPRKVNERDKCVHIHKKHYCVFWKKCRKDSLLNGVEEIDKNFKHVKNKINEKNIKQRIRYRFLKHETVDQLENVFVFDLETCNNQELAQAFTAGLYDVNRSRNRWYRDLASDELVREREKMLEFSLHLLETLSLTCLNIIQKNTMEMKLAILRKTEMM